MWINWFVLIFLVMSHVIYFVIVVEYLFFFISSGKSMNVSFLPSVIEGKEVGFKEKVSLWTQLASGGRMGVCQTDIYFYAWK